MSTIDAAEVLAVTHVESKEPPRHATEHMVRMRDGVRLATDVYLPETVEPTEVVLIRLPYDKAGDYTYMPKIAPHFTTAGYAVVVQDVRGKFRSEGVALPWVNEVDDAYDTMTWIENQSWSNGRVGMWGESYYGFTQWAAASSGHPSLRAIVPRMTGTRLGGQIEADSPEWFIDRGYRATHFVGQDTFLWQPSWTRPLAREFEQFFDAIGRRSPAWDADFPLADSTRRFPNGHPFDSWAIPTLLVLGWFDNCTHFGWRDYSELVARPSWNALLHLRVEAMDHEGYHVDDVPIDSTNDHMVDADASRRAIARMVDPAVAFFDVYLREDPAAAVPPRIAWDHVHGTWEEASTWPPEESRAVRLALRTGDTPADGAMSSGRPSPEAAIHWVHDPEDPVPSMYENSFALLAEYADERALSDRSDVLSFSTSAVHENVDLCGPVQCRLTVSTSGPYADVFSRLLDVSPDGSARFMARGQTRVRDASEPTEIVVTLAHLGYRLQQGHSLRLLVATSDSPEYVTMPGNSENPWLTTTTQTNDQTLFLGGSWGAEVELTVRGSTSAFADPLPAQPGA